MVTARVIWIQLANWVSLYTTASYKLWTELTKSGPAQRQNQLTLPNTSDAARRGQHLSSVKQSRSTSTAVHPYRCIACTYVHGAVAVTFATRTCWERCMWRPCRRFCYYYWFSLCNKTSGHYETIISLNHCIIVMRCVHMFFPMTQLNGLVS